MFLPVKIEQNTIIRPCKDRLFFFLPRPIPDASECRLWVLLYRSNGWWCCCCCWYQKFALLVINLLICLLSRLKSSLLLNMLSAAAHKLTAVHVIFLMFSNKPYVNPAKKFIFRRTGKKSEKKKN